MGTRIRDLRRAQKLTQEQLGERAGVSYKFIGEIERGTGNPTINTLAGIAAALNVDLADIVGGGRPFATIRELTARDYRTVLQARDSLSSIVKKLVPLRGKGKQRP